MLESKHVALDETIFTLKKKRPKYVDIDDNEDLQSTTEAAEKAPDNQYVPWWNRTPQRLEVESNNEFNHKDEVLESVQDENNVTNEAREMPWQVIAPQRRAKRHPIGNYDTHSE